MNADLNELRPRMMSVAYRMLGSVADAEDAVQDAYLRLQATDEVRSPEGFLVTATTRRCIDKLRRDRVREKYIGPWVPEPVNTRARTQNTALADSLSQAFLLLMERLSPDERAAFLLRTVFDYEYAEIAEVVGKSEVSVRQIVSRAKSRLTNDKPRFRPSPHEAEGIAEQFVAACRTGDVKQVEQLFTENVEVHSDGGGKVSAARVVILGQKRAARFLAGVFRKRGRYCEIQSTTVNGEPGLVFKSGNTVVQVVSLDIESGIRAVYMTSNPEKLCHWSVAEVE